MENENLEEEVLDQDTQPTEEESYESEYDKAWSDEEDLEQPQETDLDEADEQSDEEVAEDSKQEDEAEESEESSENKAEEEPTEEDFVKELKWKGKRIPVTDDELVALAQKGFDAQKKWQDVAEVRPYHEIIKESGLTIEQIKTLADVVGNKNPEALALLAKQSGIDLYDAEHRDYQPIVEQKNYELDDVISEINQNEEIATQMNDYVSSVPKSVKDRLISEPAILRGLNIDMQQGIGQQVMPEVIKQLAINPNQDFVRLYQEVGTKLLSQQEAPKQEVKPKREEASLEDKRRVAIPKSNPAPKKSKTNDYDAVWDDDKEFNRIKARLEGFN